MHDNVHFPGSAYFRRDPPRPDDIERLRQGVRSLDIEPARRLELLDVLLRDRRRSRAPGLRFLQGLGALLFAIAAAVFVPYPWTYLMSLPAGFVALWWLAISFAHYRNTEAVRSGARDAQRRLEGSDGLLWRFEPWLLALERRHGIRLFDALLPTCTASRNGTLRADLVSLRDYWYWVLMSATILDERDMLSGGVS